MAINSQPVAHSSLVKKKVNSEQILIETKWPLQMCKGKQPCDDTNFACLYGDYYPINTYLSHGLKNQPKIMHFK